MNIRTAIESALTVHPDERLRAGNDIAEAMGLRVGRSQARNASGSVIWEHAERPLVDLATMKALGEETTTRVCADAIRELYATDADSFDVPIADIMADAERHAAGWTPKRHARAGVALCLFRELLGCVESRARRDRDAAMLAALMFLRAALEG